VAAQRIDPFANFRFRVEIDGITQAGFTECTGPGINNRGGGLSRRRRRYAG